MLVVSRRPNETIVFPDLGITVRLLWVDRGKARLGIDAPPEIDVFRGEIVPAGSQSDHAAPAAKAARCRALVVDDDANERGLLAGLLRMNGCDCDTAADGQDALDYLASHDPPDVVLLDMIMPRCDGPETLRRIRRDARLANLRVFSVSGADPRRLGVPTGAGGFDAWFPKPLDPEKLWDAIRQQTTTAAV